MAGTIGSMTVFAKVDNRQFAKGIQKTKAMTRGLATSFTSLSGGIQTALAGVGFYAAQRFITSIVNVGDQIAKGSKRVGMATDEFQALTFAIEQSGGTAQNLEMGMRTLNSQLLVAQTTGGEAARMFQMLGLDINALSEQGQAEKLRTISKALASIDDEGKRAAIATKLFGRAGQTFAAMAGDVEGLEKEFREMGAIIDAEDLQSAEQMADIFNRLRRIAIKVGSEIGTAVLPILEGMETTFVDIGIAAANVFETIAKGIHVASRLANLFEFFLPNFAFLKQMANITGLSEVRTKPPAPKPSKTSVDMLDATEDILDAQKATSKKLTELNRTVADLPPSLQAGDAATVTAINKLIRKNNEQRVVNELKKMQEIEDDQLFELRKPKRLQTSFVLRPV